MMQRLILFWVLSSTLLMSCVFGAPSGAGFVDPAAKNAQPVHGWTVTLDPDERDAVLIHIPPRRPTPGFASMKAALDGTARGVVRLKSPPEAIAALGSTAYLAFKPASNDAPIPIMSVTAVRSGVAELWGYNPPSRLEARPALPVQESTIRGMVGTSAGLLALTQPSTSTRGEQASLYLLQQSDWANVTPALPADISASTLRNIALVHAADGTPTLALTTENELTLWQASISIAQPAPDNSPRDDSAPRFTSPTVPVAAAVANAQWSRILSAPWTAPIPPDIITVTFWGNVPYAAILAPASGSEAPMLARLDAQGVSPIATLGGLSQNFSAVPLADASRLVVLSPPLSAPKGKGPPPTTLTHTVSEYSLISGRVWYSGPARSPNPITAGDFRIVVAALIVLMGMVLFVVLRPNKSPAAITLPEHASLADPTRRFIAGLIDLSAAIFIGSRLAGLDVSDLLSLTTWLSDQAIINIACIAGFGFVAGTVGEALTGRSLGKLITGCEVISVAHPDQPDLPFIAALIRNAIKWGLPPVAVLGLFDPGLRHKGDDFANSAVVIWNYPEEDDMGD
jgi:hypothetical protein